MAKERPRPSKADRIPAPAPGHRGRPWLWGALGGGVAILVAGLSARHTPKSVAPSSEAAKGALAFVGSDACASCHAAQFAAWQGSQHARAMQRATPEAVRGNFEDASFDYAGVDSKFSHRDGKYFVRTDGPDGKLADFEVKYTFGLEPLQQYLVELPGGRLQALSLAYDTRSRSAGGERWLHLYPDEKVDFRDELHWTKRQQNWNFMCADCHSVNVRKNYDAATRTFATEWSEISVGCEACHGPGSAHLAWANAPTSASPAKGLTVMLDERRGVGWAIDVASGNARRSAGRSTEREIQVCAPCHSRRAQFAEGHVAGRPLLDYYVPALLTPPLYYADGQQRGEVYIWGSFLQSRMYRQGVTCSDCHEPHTQKLRAEGNALCGTCHALAKYDAKTHHFHEPGSQAGLCVSCHMPATTYMVVDPRRDHGMRVPRPDLSVTLGVPNACNQCHRERDAAWAAAAVRRWYGHDASGMQNYAAAFHGGEASAPGAAAALVAVAGDAGQPGIARASALERLGELGDPALRGLAREASRDAEALLRLAAATVAQALPVSDRLSVAEPLLADSLRAIRIEAAHALSGLPDSALTPASARALASATDEYVAAQRLNADRPEAQVAMGSHLSATGHIDAAMEHFETAMVLDPAFVPAYVNAADACRAAGRESEARSALQRGLAAVPDAPTLHHALGLWFVRNGQGQEALVELKRAMQLAPTDAHYAYVFAVALNSAGQTVDALRVIDAASRRWPGDHDILLASVTLQRDAGHLVLARAAAQRLVAAFPDDREARGLQASLQ